MWHLLNELLFFAHTRSAEPSSLSRLLACTAAHAGDSSAAAGRRSKTRSIAFKPSPTRAQACLAQYRDRYHELLNFEVATSVRAALQRRLQPLTVKTAEEADSFLVAAGLPAMAAPPDDAAAAAAPAPALPFQAAFSAALPQVRIGLAPCRR